MVIPSAAPPAPDSFHPSKKVQGELDKKSAVEKTSKSIADQQSTIKEAKPSASISRTAIPVPIDQSHAKGAAEVQKIAIDQNTSFETLLEFVTDSNFDKVPNKDEIGDLFQKKYSQEELDIYDRHVIFRELLTSHQPAERIFKNFELIIGDDFETILNKDDTLNNLDEHFIKAFFSLIFENPTYALQLIDKYRDALTTYRFDEDVFVELINLYGGIGMDSSKDQGVAACLEILLPVADEYLNNYREAYNQLLERLIILDLPHSFGVVLSKLDWKEEYFKTILKWDSAACLKAVEDSGVICFHLTGEAGSQQAFRCVAYLKSKILGPPEDPCIVTLREQGDINTLLAVSANDLDDVAREFFFTLEPLLKNQAPDQKKIEAEFTPILRKLLRMNSLEAVDRIVNCFINKNQALSHLLQDIYNKVKKEFLKIAPFISRYTKINQMKVIQTAYRSGMKGDAVSEDLEYAAKCRTAVEKLTAKLRNGKFQAPNNQDFLELPPSSTGTSRVAALVEEIGKIRSDDFARRVGVGKQSQNKKDTVESLKSLRKTQIITPVGGHYSWASPLVNAVNLLSNDIEHPMKGSYVMKYNGIATTVQVKKVEDPRVPELHQRWTHGQLDVQLNWPSLEDCFEDLMAFDLKKPKDKSVASQEAYEKSLEGFYRKAAELVWLVGNTTPLERGSGTVAEWLLGIVHLQHGLEPPVLKTQFPQLDVLDITFPINDYKDFFTYFFEPSSLPMKTKWKDMSSLPVFNQMEALYKAKKAGSLESLKE